MRQTERVSDVVTGEAVALDLRTAELPSRIVAAIIDFFVMLASVNVLAIALGDSLSSPGIDQALAAALSIILVVAVFLGYPVVFETLSRGRTLGKMAMGLRVVRDDGGPITLRHAMVRGLVGLTLERPGLFLLGFGPAVGMVVCMCSSRGKRIGDMAAGTMVLQERVSLPPPWMPVMPPPLAAWATTVDLTGLDDSLALPVRQFLGRTGELDPVARETLGQLLAREVGERTTPGPPPGTPGWAYLFAVVAERRRREQLRAGPPGFGYAEPPGHRHAGPPPGPGYVAPPPGPGYVAPPPGPGYVAPPPGPGYLGPQPGYPVPVAGPRTAIPAYDGPPVSAPTGEPAAARRPASASPPGDRFAPPT
jgi:uncharacterized RDD family membrane protein YckC